MKFDPKLIAGLAAGGFLILLVIVALILCCLRRRYSKKRVAKDKERQPRPKLKERPVIIHVDHDASALQGVTVVKNVSEITDIRRLDSATLERKAAALYSNINPRPILNSTGSNDSSLKRTKSDTLTCDTLPPYVLSALKNSRLSELSASDTAINVIHVPYAVIKPRIRSKNSELADSQETLIKATLQRKSKSQRIPTDSPLTKKYDGFVNQAYSDDSSEGEYAEVRDVNRIKIELNDSKSDTQNKDMISASEYAEIPCCEVKYEMPSMVLTGRGVQGTKHGDTNVRSHLYTEPTAPSEYAEVPMETKQNHTLNPDTKSLDEEEKCAICALEAAIDTEEGYDQIHTDNKIQVASQRDPGYAVLEESASLEQINVSLDLVIPGESNYVYSKVNKRPQSPEPSSDEVPSDAHKLSTKPEIAKKPSVKHLQKNTQGSEVLRRSPGHDVSLHSRISHKPQIAEKPVVIYAKPDKKRESNNEELFMTDNTVYDSCA